MTRRLALALIAIVVFASACSDTDKSSLPEYSSSPQPSDEDKSPVDEIVDAMPTEPPKRPADTLDSDGAEEFSRYVLEVFWYTLAVGDGQELQSLDAGGLCQACTEHVQVLSEKPMIQVPDTEPTFEVVNVVEASNGEWIATVDVGSPPGQQIDPEQRTVLDTYDAVQMFFSLQLSWRDDRWSLDGYFVEENQA